MTATVSVGCKIPCGLVLRLFEMRDVDQQFSLGGEVGVRTIRQAFAREGVEVTLKGFARQVGKDSPHEVFGGAGITHGVDEEFFDEWLRQNASSDIVKKGLVFAQARPHELTAQIKDHVTLKSGMESYDPSNPIPEFKGKISTAKAA